MKETTIAFVTFFMSIVVIAQIKLISRLVKMRRERKNIQGIMYTYRSPCTACCFGCECCLECLWGERIRRKKETEYEKSVEEQKVKELKEFEEKKELSEKEGVITEKKYITEEEVIDRLKDLADDKEKTNLQWISTVTAIPIERIVKTLAEDPNFMVEG
ncbi:MAG: hypothetical protein FK730_15790, partial [Asgard group archaeon]|nr:hypothetical protein [Asgard group archaeon]